MYEKKLFTFLLALTASIGMMWAETVVVINKSEFTSSGVTKEGVTLALSNGSMTSSDILAMDGSFEFSTSLGKFTGITIETDANIMQIYEGAYTSAGWPTGQNLGTSAVWTGESETVLISCMVAGMNTITITCTIEPALATENSITINESSHGSVVASSSSAAVGETITLTATPDDGYQLKSISGVYEAQATSSETLNFVNGNTTATGTKFQCVGTIAAGSKGWRVYNPGTANTLTVSSLNGTTLITKIEFTSAWGNSRTNNMLSVSAGTLSFDGSNPSSKVTINDINATSVTISGSGDNAGKTWCITSVKVYYEGTDEVELEISDTENANVKTFTMVDSEVTISAEFEPAPASTPNSIVINGTPAVGDNSISLTYYFDPANVPGITGYAPTLKVKCVEDGKYDEIWLSLSEPRSGTQTINLNTLGEFEAGKSYEVCFAYYNGSWVDEMFQSFTPAAPTPTTEEVNTNPDPENPSYHYSTFFHSTQNYALTNDGTTAFVADLSGSDLVLTEIAKGTQVIPANTAVILRKSGSNEPVVLNPTEENGVSFEANNDLQGVDEATLVTDIAGLTTTNCYVLSGTAQYGVGFYRINGTTLKAHKAYVIYSGNNGPKRMRFVFNTATGVEEVGSETVNTVRSEKILRNGQLIIIKNGVRYNAQGQIVK